MADQPALPEGDSWAAIIREVFEGLPKLLAGVKDIILALGVLYGAWATASTSGKLDAQGAKLDIAADKADSAATKTEEVKQVLAATTIDRDERLATMHQTDLSTNATVAALKAEVTKDPEDMDRAKAARARLEQGPMPPPIPK